MVFFVECSEEKSCVFLVRKHKPRVHLDSPATHGGFCILELSRVLMFKFGYNVLIEWYKDGARLLATPLSPTDPGCHPAAAASACSCGGSAGLCTRRVGIQGRQGHMPKLPCEKTFTLTKKIKIVFPSFAQHTVKTSVKRENGCGAWLCCCGMCFSG